MLEDIRSGKLEYIEFDARVYRDTQNKNYLRVRAEDLNAFATSFKNKPFMRDHSRTIEDREGTIIDSRLSSTTNEVEQTIRITTRRGMEAYIEGKIDRFSVGFQSEEKSCSICHADYMQCTHYRGKTYDGKICELILANPLGIETSAVIDPAVDGTAILSTMDERKSKHKEKKNMTEQTTPTTSDPIESKIEANRAAAAQLMGETQRLAEQDKQLQQSHEILVAQCAILLNSGISTSRLPEVTANRIRKQFEDKTFTALELQNAIDDARQEISALTQNALVRGPGRIEGMTTGADQLTAAVYDLMDAPRPERLAKVGKVPRLTGVRDMYLQFTGDHDFMGRTDNEHYELAQTTDLPALLVDAMNVQVDSAWAQYAEVGYEWWKSIVDIRHSNTLQTPKGVLIGQVNTLPTIAEGNPYTELALEDSKEVGAWTKSGGYIGLTLEMILKDETERLKAYPRILAFSGIRKLSSLIAAVFTSNSGAGPTMADTKALFHSDHLNLGTVALSSDEWDVGAAAIYAQPLLVNNSDDGGKQAVDPRYLLVPRALRLTARRILYPSWEREANITSENLQRGQQGDVIVVPEFTDANDWAQVVDPRIVPGIVLTEIFGVKPQVYTMDGETAYTMFMNDEMRIKARHIVSVFVENHRPLRKYNVT